MPDKTKKELIEEIAQLSRKVVRLEKLSEKYRQAEKEKADAEKFLENVFNTSLDGIIVADAYGTVTMVNQAVQEMFGYSREELIGKNTVELRPNGREYAEKGMQFVIELLEKGSIRGVERTWRRKDGSHLEVELNVALIKSADDDIIGSVGTVRDVTRRRQAERQLMEHQEKLRSLASQLTLTEERERRSFAAYLHDHIGQALFILKINLETLLKTVSAEKTSRQLEKTTKNIEQLIRDTRSLTFELSPPILYQLGFEAALDWLFEQMQEQYGIVTAYQDDGQPKPLSEDVLVVMFRGVRELMINIAKHARTKQASVSVSRDKENIRLVVQDSGVGFSPNQKSNKAAAGGYGLFSIRERAEFLGGGLEVTSSPRQGTRVVLTAPLNIEDA